MNRMNFCLISAILLALSQNLPACTVCMGANGGPLGEAANGAIFVMLGALVLVFSFVGAVGYSIVRRANSPLPPHAELARAMSHLNSK